MCLTNLIQNCDNKKEARNIIIIFCVNEKLVSIVFFELKKKEIKNY